MLDGAGLDFGPLQELCRTGSVISEGGIRRGWGHAKCGAGFGSYHSGVYGHPRRCLLCRINRKRAAALIGATLLTCSLTMSQYPILVPQTS